MRTAIHKLRVNVKSLAAEARFIRQEIKRAHRDAKYALHGHRVMRVKPEARMAHLALAFFKGTPYKVAENFTRSEPSARELTNKLNRFARVEQDRVEGWLKA